MSDRIELLGLRLLGTHGALAFEKLSPQPFELDIWLESDFAKPASSDDLVDAVDYSEIVAGARLVVEDEHYALLESLAEAVAQKILVDQRIEAVTVRLTKLRPPVPADLQSAGVTITRRRAV